MPAKRGSSGKRGDVTAVLVPLAVAAMKALNNPETRRAIAEQGRSEERLRIARELHDALGHHLTAMSLNLEIAAHRTSGEARDNVRAAQSLARLLLGDVRELAHAMKHGRATDLDSDVRPGPVRPDHVLGLGSASITLARGVVRDPVDRALDLGTGCGIQALHLSEHARAVTATDVNPRALALAAATGRLNGRHWDLRAGSLYEPVAGEKFDLIVLDPPSFTKSKGGLRDALRGYNELHVRAFKLLSPDGLLATFSCSGGVDDD